MSGAPHPASSMRRLISEPAAAASGTLTVTRTISDPASANSIHWRAVAAASAVSVIVIDCTTTGAPPPTWTLPTRTGTVLCTFKVGIRLPARLKPRSYHPAPLLHCGRQERGARPDEIDVYRASRGAGAGTRGPGRGAVRPAGRFGFDAVHRVVGGDPAVAGPGLRHRQRGLSLAHARSVDGRSAADAARRRPRRSDVPAGEVAQGRQRHAQRLRQRAPRDRCDPF